MKSKTLMIEKIPFSKREKLLIMLALDLLFLCGQK